jgi:acyl-CoA dehydrogenase
MTGRAPSLAPVAPVTPATPATPASDSPDALLGEARRVAAVLGERAAVTDVEGRFPVENLALLRGPLLGLLVPRDVGGPGGSLRTFSAVAQELAGACLSTALIWAMHQQQVATLCRAAGDRLRRDVLPAVGAGDRYLASVTTERGKGGHLMTARQPLTTTPDGAVAVERDGPVVTGAEQADGYLLTMRSAPQAPESAVALVYVAREQARVTVSGSWQALGMRGAESRSMQLSAVVPADQVLADGESFRKVASAVLIPAGHIGWAACWLGAARAALGQVVGLLRHPRTRARFPVDSDLFGARLAAVRLRLDAVGAFLARVVDEAEAVADGRLDPLAAPVQLHVNGLKVFAAQETYAAVNALVELVGMSHGYLRGGPVPLERVLRDLRAASLTYADDRLLVANGWLTMLDREVRTP